LQNDVFKHQEVMSEHEIRVLWTCKLPGISYFTEMREKSEAKKIQKTVLRTRLKTKESTYSFVIVKYLVDSF
jgi:hypothetical protein